MEWDKDKVIHLPTMPRDSDDVRLWSAEMRLRQLENKVQTLAAALVTVFALNLVVAIMWFFLN